LENFLTEFQNFTEFLKYPVIFQTKQGNVGQKIYVHSGNGIVFPEENPIPTKYILTYHKIKVNIFFRYYSTDFSQEKSSRCRQSCKDFY